MNNNFKPASYRLKDGKYIPAARVRKQLNSLESDYTEVSFPNYLKDTKEEADKFVLEKLEEKNGE